MKKTIILLALLIGLGALAYFFTRDDQSSSFDLSDREFAVENIDDVYKVLIVPRNMPPTTLVKESNQWYINDKYLVQRSAMNNLLEVVGSLTMKFIPERAALKNIKREMSQIGIKVNVYGKNNNLLKSYYIGGGTHDERGTYVMMEGATQPYVTHLRTMEGSVRGRFLLSETAWRDRTVFKNDTDKIVSVKVEYPKDQSQSFSLKRNGDGYTVEQVNSTFKTQKKADSSKSRAYIEGLDILVAENIESNNPKRDSIQKLLPFSIVSFTLDSGETKSMRLIPLLSEDESEQIGKALASSARITRYFADCSWGEFMLVQQRLVKKLLVGYSHFK